MDIQDTDTFNNKPVWQNAAAVVFGAIGVYFLAQAWLYHMLVQLITIPKDKWINPLADENCVPAKEYPNMFCDVLCNIEITMIHQLSMLRTNFGEEYCNEGNDNG